MLALLSTMTPSTPYGFARASTNRRAKLDPVVAAHALREHGELVAVQASHPIAPAQAPLDAVGDVHQEFLAGGVSERVVDALEAIDVQVEHGEAAMDGAFMLEGLGEALEEAPAIDERGQAVAGDAPQLRVVARGLGGLALRGFHARPGFGGLGLALAKVEVQRREQQHDHGSGREQHDRARLARSHVEQRRDERAGRIEAADPSEASEQDRQAQRLFRLQVEDHPHEPAREQEVHDRGRGQQPEKRAVAVELP
jgi:hypothetical protein